MKPTKHKKKTMSRKRKSNEVFSALYEQDTRKALKLVHEWTAGTEARESQLYEVDSYGNRIHHLAASLGDAEVIEECCSPLVTIAKPTGASLKKNKWQVFVAGQWHALSKKENLQVDVAEDGEEVEGFVYDKVARWRQDAAGRRFPILHLQKCADVNRVLDLDLDLTHAFHNGLVLGGENGQLVLSVFEGSCAWMAGICVGDEIKSQQNGKITVGPPSTATPVFPVDAANSFGQTCLPLAIRANKRDAVNTLLRMKADPNLNVPIRLLASEKTGTGATYDHGVAEFEFGPGLCLTGLKFDVNVTKASSIGINFHTQSSPYIVYSSFGQAAVACVTQGDELLSIQGKPCQGMDFCTLQGILRHRPCWMRFRKGKGLWRSPLHLASSLGETSIIADLIKQGARVNDTDVCDYSPIDIAVQKGNIDAVTQLIQMGATYTPHITLPDQTQMRFNWPSYWNRAILPKCVLSITQCGRMTKALASSPELVPFFQEMLNKSHVNCRTRDRRDGSGTPSWFRVKAVELAVNGLNFREYQQRKATMTAWRRDEDMSIPNGLKNDMDWSRALQQISPNGQFEYPINPRQGEMYLFHGTKVDAARKIAMSDFKLSLTGTNAGTLYGRGIYFAESPSKSDEYTTEINGWRAMIVCRVLTGKYYYTDEARPNAEDLTAKVVSGQYDSILGDREKAHGTFREFVVFDDDQVYPEWIIWYERRYDSMQWLDIPTHYSARSPNSAKATRVCHNTAQSVSISVVPAQHTMPVTGSSLASPQMEQTNYVAVRNLVSTSGANGGPVVVFFQDGQYLDVSLNFDDTSFADLLSRCQKTTNDDTPHVFYIWTKGHYEKVTSLEHNLGQYNVKPYGHIFLLPVTEDGAAPPVQLPCARHDGFVGSEHQHKINRLQHFFDSRTLHHNGKLTRGEVRSILWPLRLDDKQFDTVFTRFDFTKSDTLLLAECHYLVGKQALAREDDTTLEELLIEAAEHILGTIKGDLEDLHCAFRGEEVAEAGDKGDLKHEDFDNLDKDITMSKGKAFATNGGTNFFGILTLVVFVVGIVLGILYATGVILVDRDTANIGMYICLAVGILSYVIHCIVVGCSGEMKVLGTIIEGMDTVLAINTTCRQSPLRYTWSITCYHYETRIETYTDQNGNTSCAGQRGTRKNRIPQLTTIDDRRSK
eukprot:GEMP01003040.1.p1 GENE.GEMP01003040.1~~GEMP01003040.1.p1  ORF type:complete len:1165 (+),score=206.13 GEMP01003040.1:73-3567(+)